VGIVRLDGGDMAQGVGHGVQIAPAVAAVQGVADLGRGFQEAPKGWHSFGDHP